MTLVRRLVFLQKSIYEHYLKSSIKKHKFVTNVHFQFLWIPVIQEKNFVARGFGARQQEALVVSVPLLLRSSISESAHETQNFSLELRKQKKRQ